VSASVHVAVRKGEAAFASDCMILLVKVILSMELHKAIIYTTKVSKWVTRSHVRMQVTAHPVN
jgi:hypothetical protein